MGRVLALFLFVCIFVLGGQVFLLESVECAFDSVGDIFESFVFDFFRYLFTHIISINSVNRKLCIG